MLLAECSAGGVSATSVWHGNGYMGTDGWTVSAKYVLGAIAPSFSYRQLENKDGGDESFFAADGNYAVGRGLVAFIEHMALDVENATADKSGEETILLSGVMLDF